MNIHGRMWLGIAVILLSMMPIDSFAIKVPDAIYETPYPPDDRGGGGGGDGGGHRCHFYDPRCWVEEAFDFGKDLMEDVAELAWDVLTLDPKGVYYDLVDIVQNIFCGRITLQGLIGADVAEGMYNNSCAAPHTIAPKVLEQLRPYFKSSFESVVIHEDCDFENRGAITFGEHIYFPAKGIHGYHPLGADGKVDPAGFALLAHELVHVLQYRREGFADFICRYWQECIIRAELSGEAGVSCKLEQEAYMFEALVREDVQRDGDGIFTCALGKPPKPSSEWNARNVHLHTCVGKALLDNCPNFYNPGQLDTDHDGLGDGCDPPSPTLDPAPAPEPAEPVCPEVLVCGPRRMWDGSSCSCILNPIFGPGPQTELYP